MSKLLEYEKRIPGVTEGNFTIQAGSRTREASRQRHQPPRAVASICFHETEVEVHKTGPDASTSGALPTNGPIAAITGGPVQVVEPAAVAYFQAMEEASPYDGFYRADDW